MRGGAYDPLERERERERERESEREREGGRSESTYERVSVYVCVRACESHKVNKHAESVP